MKATAMLRILTVLGLLALCAQAQAAEQAKPDPWTQKVNLEVSNMTLPEALEALFRDSGISYVIEAGVVSPNLTLVLKNVTLRTALDEIARAAGNIRVDAVKDENGGALVRVAGSPIPFGPRSPLATSRPPAQGAMITNVFTPNYLSAPELASVLSGPGVGAQTTNNGKLILTGTEEDIQRAEKMMRALDVPPPSLQPYRVALSAKITLREEGEQPRTFDLTSESVGLEGEPIPVEINSRRTVTVPLGAGHPPTYERNASVSLQILPPDSSAPKGALRLSGDGHLKVSEKASSYEKNFDFALCAQPGERVVIARGSSDFGDMGAEFEVSVMVTLERGKVARPARMPQPPGAPGFGPSPGNFGGGGYGGSYGAPGGPMGPNPSPAPAGQPGVSRTW